MEDHHYLSIGGLEQSDVHAVARSKAVYRGIAAIMRSLSSKLLGTYVLAHLFQVAAAGSTQDAYNNDRLWGLWSRFDLIGLIAIFRTAAAWKSISYAALNDSVFYITGHIGPGSLSIAAALFEATEFSMARLFALGGTGDAYTLVGLDSPERLRYIALRSGTECPVVNAIGAAILREYDSLWKKKREDFLTSKTTSATTAQPTQEGGVRNQNVHEQNRVEKATPTEPKEGDTEKEAGRKVGTPVGRDARRSVKVIFLKMKENTNIEGIRVSLSNQNEKLSFLAFPIIETSWARQLVLVTLLISLLFLPFISRPCFHAQLTCWRHWLHTQSRFWSQTRFHARLAFGGFVGMIIRELLIRCCFRISQNTFILSGWLPSLLTLLVIISCFHCEEIVVGLLMVVGTLAMILAVVAIRVFYGFEYALSQPAEGAPKGDCLVVDDKNPDIFHIIKADENVIQTLFQRKIKCEPSHGSKWLFIAGFLLYVYAIGSVLLVHGSTFVGKIHFIVANMIGLVADMYNASRDGKLGLAKKACEQFGIEFQGESEFKNRTAAVAFVAKQAAHCKTLKSKKLLPCDGPVWEDWWDKLEEQLKTVHYPDENEKKLSATLLGDMMVGLAEDLPGYCQSSPSDATTSSSSESPSDSTTSSSSE